MVAFLSSVLIGSLIAFGMSLWRKKTLILALISFGIWSGCVLPTFSSANVAAPFVATILSVEVICIFVFNNQNKPTNRSLIVWGMWLVWSSIDQTSSSDLMTHPLAPFHLVAAALAKSFALVGVLVDRRMLRSACILQLIAVLLGMVWAFDAPTWGRFWQWDPVETLSLIEFLILLIASKSGSRLGSASVLLALGATDLLSSGAFRAISIHSYQSVERLQLGFNIAFILASLALVAIRQDRCKTVYLCERIALMTFSMAMLLICAGIEIDSSAWTIFFAAMLIALSAESVRRSKRAALNYAFVALAICSLPIIDSTPSQYQVSVFKQSTVIGDVSLAIIEVDTQNVNSLQNCEVFINDTLVSIKNDKAYYYTFPGVWQIRSIGYSRAEGLMLQVTSLFTPGIWFFVVLMCLIFNTFGEYKEIIRSRT